MTTAAAAQEYLAQHLVEWAGKGFASHNPHNKPLEELPVIYGFNNGGSPGWYSGVLIADDGSCLGGHICSDEGYMYHDLGVMDGSRPDRHETFREHYPDGYRMDFVSSRDVLTHPGLNEAVKQNRIKAEQASRAS
ncbi:MULTISPECIES: hypothetical protein [unclassified Mesorhizobium]|uniref:hypothetical protein n=1 Tax=unclassified Mesorhizobium TaxID=325217 RepID=UPI000FCA7CEC|nr:MULTISPECIES: hypothetical protein [unclassified Mesorhizobium]TGP34040.1 hypothetical protein EN875_012380 [Mesorhizobium sp. M2D.F.Ca.ET.232.01.1.1]TGQ23813.1 hypothetical protein EN863_064920 [Mesorhizobium sp. M00.F.Ca.ET.220.01.1.1]TGU12193.1 hypothetical protein EN806_17350 [bacterium M00.F.Ca.ET.163.01.1.1]